MTLDPSAELIYCQTCANSWPRTQTEGMHYFRSASFPIGSLASPASIDAAGEEITFCPKCDVEQLGGTPIPDAPPGVLPRHPLYRGDDTMTGAFTDAGRVDDATPPDEDSTAVTHRT